MRKGSYRRAGDALNGRVEESLSACERQGGEGPEDRLDRAQGEVLAFHAHRAIGDGTPAATAGAACPTLASTQGFQLLRRRNLSQCRFVAFSGDRSASKWEYILLSSFRINPEALNNDTCRLTCSTATSGLVLHKAGPPRRPGSAIGHRHRSLLMIKALDCRSRVLVEDRVIGRPEGRPSLDGLCPARTPGTRHAWKQTNRHRYESQSRRPSASQALARAIADPVASYPASAKEFGTRRV